jgi:NitT/TauT family transport system substrate-binding protein
MPFVRLRRIVAVLILLGTATRSALPAIAQSSTAPTVIRVAATSSDDVTSLLYAQHSGLFAKAGLDVQIEHLANGSEIAAAVIGGTFDIGKAGITVIFDAHARGLPFTIVAPAAMYDSKSPLGGMLIEKTPQPLTGKDFNGKLVGVQGLLDIGQLALDVWVTQHGGDYKSIRYVEIPISTGATAIDQHRVFATESVNPPLAAALATGRMRLLPVCDAIAPSFLFTDWFSTTTWAKAHRDAVRRFQQALAQSAVYTNAHHTETADLLAQFTSMPLSVIQGMPRVVNGTDVRASEIQPVIDAAAKFNTIKQSFRAEEIIFSTAGSS